MKKKRYYIAYASNLDTFTMEEYCPTAVITGTGEITDFRLLFRGKADNACATIEPSPGNSVPVLVWELQNADEQALDCCECLQSLYHKEVMDIIMYPSVYEMYTRHKTNGEPIEAMVYIMNDGEEINMPSADYLNTILDGYDEAGFDPTAIENALEMSQEYALKNNQLDTNL